MNPVTPEFEKKVIAYANERLTDWETGSNPFFGLWNEWSGSYEMKYVDGEKRPDGISKNVVAETPRAVNTLATSITRMQTSNDPPFELRSKQGFPEDEEKLFYMENKLKENITQFEFKRNLLKGNRGMCLFGTQVWEKPYLAIPNGSPNPTYEGTAFRPLSLLQCAFDTTVYDMEQSDYFGQVTRVGKHYLRGLANFGGEIWDRNKIDEGIKQTDVGSGQQGFSQSSIDSRRLRAGYQETKYKQTELVLFHGKLPDEILEMPDFQQMWAQYGRTDDPRFCDITLGILNRKYLVRFHPTPYGTWHHLYNVGHYIEFELEPYAYGVGALGQSLQRDMNRIQRYANDVAKFSLFNMFLAGRGSGLKSAQMNVFPWSAIQVDDVNQIKPLTPQVEGILNGLKLQEMTREDFRGVTHATSTLQAVLTGATATEASLAMPEALRAISLCAEVNGDSVIRPYYTTSIINMIDQNPYDARMMQVDVTPKLTTDKDFKPQQAKMLMDFAQFATSASQMLPIDFNIEPVLEYLGRSAGINPREFKKPKTQADRMLEVMRRLNNGNPGAVSNSVAGQVTGERGNISSATNEPVPNSPLQVMP